MAAVRNYVPETLDEALLLRKAEGAVPLAGGTDIMVQGKRGIGLAPAADKPVMIISSLKELKGIAMHDDGSVEIGALTTAGEIAQSLMVPWHVRMAASGMGAVALRNTATIGGNIALSRFDSYMIPALYVSDAVLFLISPAGRRSMKIDEYILSGDRDSIIESILVQDLSEGKAVRFARSSHAHAALTAAQAAGRYAYAVSGSGFAFGDKDSYSAIDYRDDLAGSGAYKRYLASVCFGEAAL